MIIVVAMTGYVAFICSDGTHKCKLYRFIRYMITISLHKYSTNEYNKILRTSSKKLDEIHDIVRNIVEWYDTTDDDRIRNIAFTYLGILNHSMDDYKMIFKIRHKVLTRGYFKKTWMYRSLSDMYHRVWKEV